MPTLTSPPQPCPAPRTAPRNGELYAVRWVRTDGRDVKHRYFRRWTDALTFAQKLRSYGKRPRVYVTDTTWTEVAR